MRLILLRHGETEWNKESRLQGHENSELSERGIEQVKAIKRSIELLAPKRVVASDLGRTRHTSEIIGYPDATFDCQLRELNMGEWTGLRKPDLIKASPETYKAWRAGTYTPKNGESWAAFCHRIYDGLRFWIHKEDSDLLAVVHSGVVRAACRMFLNLEPDHLLPTSPGSLTIFNFDDKDNAVAKLEAYNIGAFLPDDDVAD